MNKKLFIKNWVNSGKPKFYNMAILSQAFCTQNEGAETTGAI